MLFKGEKKKMAYERIGHLFYATVPVFLQVSASIHFNEIGMVADDDSFLMDNDSETCSAFVFDEDKSSFRQYTQFRIEVPIRNMTFVNITLQGVNLGCYDKLHVSPISENEASKWLGRWTKCLLWKRSTTSENRESCSFYCETSEYCSMIQVLRMTDDYQEDAYMICEIYFDNIREGCEYGQKNQSGVYYINARGEYAPVYCDMTTDGGGWTVLLRRMDGSVNFKKEWEDYKFGFGSLKGEFWAGNEIIHYITTDGRRFSLKVDLVAYDEQKYYAIYDDFWLGAESDNYTLHVSDYVESTAGDSLTYHDSMMFSTAARDNDMDSRNCADTFNPWWHNQCLVCILTAKYGPYPEVAYQEGIRWDSALSWTRFAKYALMMTRPKDG